MDGGGGGGEGGGGGGFAVYDGASVQRECGQCGVGAAAFVDRALPGCVWHDVVCVFVWVCSNVCVCACAGVCICECACSGVSACVCACARSRGVRVCVWACANSCIGDVDRCVSRSHAQTKLPRERERECGCV